MSGRPVAPACHVAVLMATYNGEPYLVEQLQSLLDQTHRDWSLWVSDDGSSDQTRSQLLEFAHQSGRLRAIKDGPRRGFARNFLSLLRLRDIDADYYAYCDQDDVWHPHKLARALQWFATQPDTVPAVFCSRSILVDPHGNKLGEAAHYKRAPSFANALVQCITPGNTMMLNRAARDAVVAAGAEVDTQSHDWWTYIVVTGVGGRFHYDPTPLLDYRQHGQNLVGANRGAKAQWARLRMLLAGDFREWNGRHLAALEAIRAMLTPQNRATLDEFRRIHHGGLWQRLCAYRRAGLYRQTLMGSAGLLYAASLGRI